MIDDQYNDSIDAFLKKVLAQLAIEPDCREVSIIKTKVEEAMMWNERFQGIRMELIYGEEL